MLTKNVKKMNAFQTAAKFSSNNVEENLPNHINLEKWQDVGYSWYGTIIPRNMPRLASSVPAKYLDETIDLKFEMKKIGQLLTLTMDFSGKIWVICQRCLEPLNIDVGHHNQLVLLENEAQESLVDESDDYLLLDELLDSYAENKKGERLLPIAKLIEDELLLDVPLSAKHEDCEMAVEQVGDIIEEEAESPFAALAELKGKL